MKKRLLATTAMSTLIALTSGAKAEGWGIHIFGGYNIAGNEKNTLGSLVTSTTLPLSSTPGIHPVFGSVLGINYYSAAVSGTVDAGVKFDADGGYVFGGAVGYRLDNGLILEIEAAFRKNDMDVLSTGSLAVAGALFGTFHATSDPVTKRSLTSVFVSLSSTAFAGSASLSGDGDVKATSIMANAWYEYDTGSRWKPFIGGGVGFAWIDVEAKADLGIAVTTGGGFSLATGLKVELDADESGFAWQLGAGIGYDISDYQQITLSYRYFNGPTIDKAKLSVLGYTTVVDDFDYDYDAHSIMLGFKAGF